MTNREIIQILEGLAEPGYQRFASSLIPGETQLMGVRLPQLRKLAKRLARENWQGYLIQDWGTSFEEVLLQGMILGYAKGTWEQRLQAVTAYLPQIRNWSICDSFCSSLKMPKENPQGFWEYLSPLRDAQEEFTVRFAVVMLLNYYRSPEYYSRCIAYLDGVRHPGYYAKMAVAWALSLFYCSFPQETMAYFADSSLDREILYRALCKIIESHSITSQQREEIREYRGQFSAPGDTRV